MKLKKIICVLYSLLLLTIFSICQEAAVLGESTPANFADFVMSQYDEGNRVKILAYIAPDPRVAISQESINDVAEAGYTIVLPQIESTDFNATSQVNVNRARNYLNYAQNAGLKVIIYDTNIVDPYYKHSHTVIVPDNPNKNTALYKSHPAFYGIYIDDETSNEYWPELAQKIQIAREVFPDKLLLTNTSRQYNRYSDWAEQLHIYVDTVKPNLLSYDHYPIFDPEITHGIKTDPAWLGYNATIRYIARQYGLLSNSYVLITGGYWELAQCTEEDIRWQMMVCMAYGFDILGQYAYCGFDKGEPFFIYPEAHSEKLFDSSGNRTSLYYRVKNVNSEIHKWGFIYENYDWYGTAVYKGTPGRSEAFELIPPEYKLPLSAVEGIKNITCNQDILVGAFRDKEFNNALMITNAAEPNDPSGATIVTVEFDSKYKGVMVCDKDFDKENPNIIILQDGKAEIELDASEGKLLVPLKWR